MVSGQAGDREFLSEPRSPLPTGDGRDTGLLRQCFQVKFSPKGEIKEGGNMHLISCSECGWFHLDLRGNRPGQDHTVLTCESKDRPQSRESQCEEMDRRVDGVMGDTAERDRTAKDHFISKGVIQVGAGSSQRQEAGPPWPGHTFPPWMVQGHPPCGWRSWNSTQGPISKPFALRPLSVMASA